MDVSEKKANIWNRMKNSNSFYFRILMLTLCVFTGIFFSYKFSVRADDTVNYKIRLSTGDPVIKNAIGGNSSNFGAVRDALQNSVTVYRLYTVKGPTDINIAALEQNTFHTLFTNSEYWLYWHDPNVDIQKNIKYKVSVTGNDFLLVDGNGNKISEFEESEWKSLQDRVGYYTVGDETFPYDVNENSKICIEGVSIICNPHAMILNLNDNNRDITSESYFTNNYTVTNPSMDNNGVATMTLRKNNRAPYRDLEVSDISLISGATGLTYNNQTGVVTLTGYTGGEVKIGIKPFKRHISFGSGTNTGDWAGSVLPNKYCLKIRSNGQYVTTGINPTGSDSLPWGYDYYEPVVNNTLTNANIEFQLLAKKGYEFQEGVNYTATLPGADVSSGVLSYVAQADPGNDIGVYGDPAVKGRNCMSFSVSLASSDNVVYLSGQQYTTYANTFQYENSAYTLGNVANMEVPGFSVTKSSNGKYSYNWNIASSVHSSSGANHNLSANNGYAMKRSDFRVLENNQQVGSADWNSEYATEKSFSLNNLELRDHTITINGFVDAPKLVISNLNDSNEDITSKEYFTSNYNVEAKMGVVNDGSALGIENNQITIKSDNYFIAQDDFEVLSANATISEYNNDTGILKLVDYSGGDLNIGIKPFRRRIWVGSANDDSSSMQWKNESLAVGYVLKRRTSANKFEIDGISQSSTDKEYEKGAWYYDYYESVDGDSVTNTDFVFQMIGKEGYGFGNKDPEINADNCTISDVVRKYGDKDPENDILGENDLWKSGPNCVEFKVSSVSKSEANVKVGGEAYQSYTNTFTCENVPHRLVDIATLDIVHDTDDNGNYIQSRTIGSFLKDFVLTAKQGYIIRGSEFGITVKTDNENGSTLENAAVYSSSDDYEDSHSFSLTNLSKKDYIIFVKGVKAVRSIEFSSDEGLSITEKDDEKKEFTRNGNKYGVSDAYFGLSKYDSDEETKAGLEYTVKLKVADDRKRFKSDISNDEIADAIKNANPMIRVCRVVKSEQDSGEIELNMVLDNTVTPATSGYDYRINVPIADIVEYKTCDVQFDIDITNLANSIYYNNVVNGIKIRAKNSDTLIPLSLINGHLRTYNAVSNVPYNSVKYVMTLDPAVLDLRKLKLTLDGNTDPGEEIKFSEGNSKGEVSFELVPDVGSGAYRDTVAFNFDFSKVMRSKKFELCTNVVLYEMESDNEGSSSGESSKQKNKLVSAEYEEAEQTVSVPINGKNTFLVQYVDYSQSFDLSNIELCDAEGNIVGNRGDTTYTSGRTTVDLENTSFNAVKITVTDNDAGDENQDIVCIRCKSPTPTSPPISFSAVEGVRYYSVTDDGKIDLASQIQGTINVLTDKDFSFAVKCDDGYDSSTLSMKANKNEFSETNDNFKKVDVNDENGRYSVFTIKGEHMIYPYVITGNVNIRRLAIQFNKNLGNDFGTCEYVYNGTKVDSNISVLYGEGISFSVSLPDKCSQSDIRVIFTAEGNSKGVELEKVEGKYLLNNVVTRGTISIDKNSLKTNRYPVTFKSGDRAYYTTKDGKQLSGTVNVEYNGEYSFRVNANAGYTLGENSIVSIKYSDGTTKTLESDGSGVYSTSQHGGITQPCTISVENVEDLVYTITLEPVLGVTYLNGSDNVIKDTVQVKHGNNFEFAVVLDDAYDDSKAGMSIIVNDGKSAKSSAQKLASGRYVINNVVEDIKIKVGNVKKNTYNVTLTGAEGIDYYDGSGNMITGDNAVEHHSDFSFKVELYPAYADSDITVMLGDTPMEANESGFYTISKISESKTVTVVGIEQTNEAEVVNKINSLPDNISDLGDVDDVIEATKQYEALSDAQKAMVGNADKLKELQEQVKAFHHVSNDVRVDGVDWYIKLYAIPITEDVDACGRIYKKLNNEYILSLYNVYLWNTLEDTRYTLPEGQSAVITLPTPDMTYFEKPTAIHERSTGKVEFISLSINGDTSAFETDSFSPMGIIANRSLTPGRSSLLDAADAQLDNIMEFASSAFGNDTKKVYNTSSTDLGVADDNNNNLSSVDSDETSGNIDEKFRSRNNRVTTTGSALRLILVLMILALIVALIVFFVRRQKNKT